MSMDTISDSSRKKSFYFEMLLFITWDLEYQIRDWQKQTTYAQVCVWKGDIGRLPVEEEKIQRDNTMFWNFLLFPSHPLPFISFVNGKKEPRPTKCFQVGNMVGGERTRSRQKTLSAWPLSEQSAECLEYFCSRLVCYAASSTSNSVAVEEAVWDDWKFHTGWR